MSHDLQSLLYQRLPNLTTQLQNLTMTKPIAPADIKAALGVLQAVAEAIREVGEVPSGHLYANLMGILTLGQFERVIENPEGSRAGPGVQRPPAHLARARRRGRK